MTDAKRKRIRKYVRIFSALLSAYKATRTFSEKDETFIAQAEAFIERWK